MGKEQNTYDYKIENPDHSDITAHVLMLATCIYLGVKYEVPMAVVYLISTKI